MIFYWLYKICYLLAVRFPLKIAYGVAIFLSILKYYLSPRDRRAVIGNLRKILPEPELKKIHLYAKEVFVNFGKYLIEFFRVSHLKKEDLGHYFKIEGLEYVDEALKKGKGVIILSAHIGNWELGGIFMSLLGYPMFAVALPHRHPKVNELFNYQRERLGMIVVPSIGVALRRIYDALKKNHIVALVGDRDFANSGKKMSFLGEEKIIPKGPAVLAKRTGASIVPGFMIRQADDSHVLRFMPSLPTDGTEEAIMKEYAGIIESIIRQYPAQWLMFREFWKE
jgi:KDO2-lipid IV(A) lauroyltransferase